MADEARLNELLDLVEQARAEGDKDTEAKAVAAYKRESAPAQPFPDIYGGTGGYNPMLSGVAGLTQRIGGNLGMTPENTANPLANALAPAETALQAATGAVATPIAGLAGLLTKDRDGRRSQADIVRDTQAALTYQPRTGAGAGMSRVAAAPGEAYGGVTNYLGEKTTDLTGSPAAGAFVKTIGDVAPALIGARGLPKRSNAPKLDGEYAPTKYEVPTTEQLRTATNEAYKRGEESGAMVKADSYAKAADEIASDMQSEGIDPVLHPKSSRIVQILQDRKGKDLSLQEAENLRRIALDAEGDVNQIGQQTRDGMLAGKMVDELDAKIDALSVNDEARALNRRKANSQLLDLMMERAQNKAGANYTQSGLENALRKEFLSLANNARRMKRFTPAQREAIQKVARGGKMENFLRDLGKFDPTSGVVPALATVATGGGIAFAAMGARRAATRMTENNVNAARQALVGRGMSSGGLLGGGPSTQPLAAPRGLLGATPARTPAQLRQEIASLENEVARLQSMGPASATVRGSVESELARLRRELASAEAQGARP